MTQEMLINYLIAACEFLKIELTRQSETEFHLTIPDELAEDFNNEKEYDITLKKELADQNRSYITTESFLIQKIAKLTADIGYGVTIGEISSVCDVTEEKIQEMFCDCRIDSFEKTKTPVDFLLVTSKITMRLNKIEEFIHCYKLNINSGECIEIPLPESEYITSISPIKAEEYNSETISKLYETVVPHITDTVNTHFSEKQTEYAGFCSKEIERINEYYDLLIKEKEESSDDDKAESLNLLKLERDNLINEQNKKYAISKNSVTVEAVSVCLIRETGEKADIKLSNNYGSIAINISSLKEIKSFYSDNTTLPLTITSENHLCNAGETFFCAECGKKHYVGNSKKCSVCGKVICNECAVISPVSGAVVCKEHSRQCPSCNAVVTEKEVFSCGQCGKQLCLACNSKVERCSICNTLLCNDCKTTSAVSGKAFCKKHTAVCIACNSPVGSNEFATCSSCSVNYCLRCTNGNTCKMCATLRPADAEGMQIVRMLSAFNLKASSFTYSKSGYVAVVKGKKMFGGFIAVVDLRNNRLISKKEFGMFGNKK